MTNTSTNCVRVTSLKEELLLYKTLVKITLLKQTESFGCDTTTKSCESLIFTVPWEKEIRFYRNSKEEKILK